MQSSNPYSPPISPVQPEPASTNNIPDAIEITPAAVVSLLSIRGWLKIIGFAMGLFCLIFVFVASQVNSSVILLRTDSAIYAPLAIGILAPLVLCICMFKLSAKIKNYSETKSDAEFQSFASSQGTLFTSLSTVCILSILAFIFAIFAIFSAGKSMAEKGQDRDSRSEPYSNNY